MLLDVCTYADLLFDDLLNLVCRAWQRIAVINYLRQDNILADRFSPNDIQKITFFLRGG